MPTQTFFNLDQEKQDRITDAAINEFSVRSYDEAKLSNIIRESKIPRGSFYQYFTDKMDIYKFIFTRIGELKMAYMGGSINNTENIPFLELFRILYQKGMQFAYQNPKAVKITSLLLSSKGIAFDEVMKDNLALAKTYYKSYIETDQKLGRINPNIDSEVLTELFVNMTVNTSIDHLSLNDNKLLDLEKLNERVEKVLYILEKGIMAGDTDV
jgi:AcrR family transcriptional regulator